MAFPPIALPAIVVTLRYTRILNTVLQSTGFIVMSDLDYFNSDFYDGIVANKTSALEEALANGDETEAFIIQMDLEDILRQKEELLEFSGEHYRDQASYEYEAEVYDDERLGKGTRDVKSSNRLSPEEFKAWRDSRSLANSRRVDKPAFSGKRQLVVPMHVIDMFKELPVNMPRSELILYYYQLTSIERKVVKIGAVRVTEAEMQEALSLGNYKPFLSLSDAVKRRIKHVRGKRTEPVPRYLARVSKKTGKVLASGCVSNGTQLITGDDDKSSAPFRKRFANRQERSRFYAAEAKRQSESKGPGVREMSHRANAQQLSRRPAARSTGKDGVFKSGGGIEVFRHQK